MKKILIFIVVLLGQLSVKGQIIAGIVTDADKNPLPYVNIGVVGLSKGTISSRDGKYSIDISGIDNEKIIRFSMVGFESVEFSIGKIKLQRSSPVNITLKKRMFHLPEVVVKPDNEKPVFIGAKKAGNMSWVWSKAINGAEIGTLFRNDKTILLDKFYFHVRRNFCDSILYRIKIYAGSDEYPNEIINTKDIRFVSKAKKGWESISIAAYEVTIDTDFIITLETLESWTSGNYQTTHLSVGQAKGGLSYSRSSSMAPWEEFGNQMSFKIEIKESNK